MMNLDETDEQDSMRLAFEQFMLGGNKEKHISENESPNKCGLHEKNNKKKKKKRGNFRKDQDDAADVLSHKIEVDADLNEDYLHNEQHFNEMKRYEKRCWNVFHRFCSTLQNDWFSLDDQLLDVIQSISELRHRMLMQAKCLHDFAHHKDRYNWLCHGNSKIHMICCDNTKILTKADVELALSHDIIQHEKMMAGVRSLLSNLSEIQDTLGTSLDKIMQQQLEVTTNQCKRNETLINLVNEMNNIFVMLAMEIYRKQILAQMLIESTAGNDILYSSHQSVDNDEEDGARKTATFCCRRWPRNSKYSLVDHERVGVLLQMRQYHNNSN